MSSDGGLRRGGFSLIEVLVAVVVLSLVATASLKLVIMAQNGLAEAKEREKLLSEAAAVQLEVRLGQVRSSGKSGDVEWRVEDKENEGFDEDFGRLKLGESADATSDQVRFDQIQWKEIEVTKDGARKVVLYLPHQLEAATVSEDAVSSDSSALSGDSSN